MKEIVIKIPDEVLSFVYQNGFIREEDRNTVHHAILQCAELPKGHDRLIEAKEAQAYLYRNMEWYDEDGYITDDEEKDKALQDLIDGIPTFIEADKGDEE